MRFLIPFALVLFTISRLANAESPEPMLLWPNGAPGAGGNEERDKPDLTVYRAHGDTPRAAIVVLPGGGYGGLAIGHEGFEIAEWCNNQGVTAAICRYRHRNKGNGGDGYKHPYPMLDAQRAIRTVRANSKEWNIDPDRIGIIGFSAGGHLASTTATHFDLGDANATDPIDRVSCRPDFAVLCYPVIAFNQPYTHKGSQRNLLGESAKKALVESLSNEKQVTKETPPVFLFHTTNDQAVPPENSVQFYLSCIQNGVPAEMHVFEKGRHGVGLAKNLPGAQHWPTLLSEWLKTREILR